MIKILVVGNQEGRVHRETGLGKEEFRQRRDNPEKTESIG